MTTDAPGARRSGGAPVDSAAVAETHDDLDDRPSSLVVGLMLLAAAIPLVARFVVGTELWLDEALSVNIAKLPISDLAEALRHDGHPPLYYVLLHGWMQVFGDGNLAVRAMSGVISLAALPLAYAVGRRIGGPRLGLLSAWALALSPFFLRYGSETRMYALVVVLVLAGYLAVDRALESPSLASLAGVALTSSALLWTHYWALWLLATVGILLLVDVVVRTREARTLRPPLAVIGAMAAGGVAFAPWLPVMLYQSEHTGTPWAEPFRPASVFITTVTDFSGGPYSEAQVLMLVTVVLALLGLFASGSDGTRLTLDLRTLPEARVPAALVLGTMALASLVSLVLGAGFASRYAAVFFPFWTVLVAIGLSRFVPGTARTVVFATFAVMSLVGCAFVFRQDRTQAGVVADAIRERGEIPSIVVTCPDQLGPAVARALGASYDVRTYPRLAAPERVDWVDYGERNARNDPDAFAEELLERAGDRTIWFAYGNDYLTLEGQCARVATRITEVRAGRIAVTAVPTDYYEPMTLMEFPAPESP